MDQEQKHTLKSADKLFEILEYVLDEGEGTALSVAEAIDFNRSTVHVHLQTLVKHGYLVQDENLYRPSLKFLKHSERVRDRIPFYQKGKDEVDELAAETGELVNMASVEQESFYLLYISEGEKAIHNHLPGKQMAMHASAVGKAILAHLPTDDADRIINKAKLTKITENTITDEDELRTELETIRSQGFAVDAEEGGIGIRCLAAPVRSDERIVGAVSITGPTKRIGGEYEKSLQTKITNLANVIEVKMKYE
ncbi:MULTISPECIES: IclR family transcriptional regulator [unclassified Haloferax]|uniref:IclR family transcriptional regulator n=1 Tax=unclassified Haloferax TaxID=2625095 RepID=UPI0013147086|nr:MULTISPECIES: IclR family transcriptional regulator [unclassified Haloferax]